MRVKNYTNHIPQNGFEERVIDDVSEASLWVTAKAIHRIFVEETLQNGGSFHR